MIDDGRWRRAEDLFHRALHHAPTERAEFVRLSCLGDDALCERVLDMLLETSVDDPPNEIETDGEPASTPTLRFGRYDVVREIGRGGMGVVYEARQTSLNRSVALKVLRSEGEVLRGGGTREKYIRMASRFVEEAEVLGLLDHPGIVPVLELDREANGVTWFTMRLVQGDDLRVVFERVAQGVDGWTQHRALGVIRRACDAMSFAHHRGVLHRDLKPSNIMVGRFGEVYLIDWGLARILGRTEQKDVRLRDTTFLDAESSDDSLLRTVDGDVVGTPAYMSPEQALGRLDRLGPHSDVYSVGAILYQLLTGRPPFTPPGERDVYAVLERVRTTNPDPIASLAPNVAPELAAICEKAMARDIRRRYRDTEELASDLDAFLSHHAVRAYRTGAVVELKLWYVRNRSLARIIIGSLTALVVSFLLLIFFYVDLSRRNDEVFHLSVGKDLRELVATVDRMWPADENHLPELATWLARADQLLAGLPGHAARLEQLRESALPWSAQDQADDRANHPKFAALPEARRRREHYLAQRENFAGDPDPGFQAYLPMIDDLIRSSEQEITTLEQEIARRRTWRFASRDDAWWHEQLQSLVEQLTLLGDRETGLVDGVSPEHGWGVRRRYRHATTIREESISSPAPLVAWATAIQSIADKNTSPIYNGLRIVPQVGLVPLRRQPESGLWEFWHVATGTRPTWDAARDAWSPSPTDGLIFVLLPGGRHWIGAENDAGSRHYDPMAGADEGPVHEVTLEPFFISKFEMTQGQWQRFAGYNPSIYQFPHQDSGRDVTLVHPVESVDYDEAAELLRRLGLMLPTEAEWEYAGRAGSSTPWWSGNDTADLDAVGNLADTWFGFAQKSSNSAYDSHLDDGWGVTAPVGAFRRNAFGLYDTVGNVAEWCHGSYGAEGYREGSEQRTVPTHVARGGGLSSLPLDARSANRMPQLEEQGNFCIGVRPCRSLSKPQEEQR